MDPTVPTYAKMNTVSRAALAALRSRPLTTAEVAAAVGRSHSSVYNALARHRGRGLVEVAGYAHRSAGVPDTRWRLTRDGRAFLLQGR
jgi:predicted ArsR family transcriptional regulator